MDKELAALRRRITRVPMNGRGRRRYSKELRAEIVEMAQAVGKQGLSRRAIANQLGMCTETLAHWLIAAPKPRKRRRSRVVPVSVVEDRPTRATSIVLETPSGLRIEGVSIAEAIQIARELD